MFEEVKEMIDSTIYENGRGEITAQNINLAMHGVIGAVEDKVTELEQSAGNGGSGALRWWLAHESFGVVNTPEQTAENIATYNKLVEDKYASVILCGGMDMSSFSTYTSAPVVVQHAIIGGETHMILFASVAVEEGYPMECTAVLPYPDGTMEVFLWEHPSTAAPSGPLYIVTDTSTDGSSLTDEQKSDNVRTYNILMSGENVPVYMVTQIGGISSIQTILQTLINREENIVQLSSFRYNGQGGVNPTTVTLYSDGTYSVA